MTDLTLARAGTRRAWRREIRATLSLSWPIILTNLAQMALNTTDVVMMGRLGPEALAAGALGFNLYFPLCIFGIGVLSAVAPMVAREVGARHSSVRDVRRTVRQGLWAALAITLPVWIILWHAEPILITFGQEPALASGATHYMRTLQWAYLPFLVYLVLRSFVTALERPLWAFVIVGGSVPLNILADWCLIFGNLGFPRLELAGAGVATTLVSTVMFAGLVVLILRDRGFRRYYLFGRFWRPDWPRFRHLWRLGLPIAATLVFEVSIFNAAVFLMGLVGPDALAAHTIAIQIAALTFMVPLGFSQAVTVRIGRAFGAGDSDGVRRAGWTAYAMGVGFMGLTACVMLFAPRLLIAAFLDISRPENAPVVGLAVTFLMYAALFQVADGAQAVGSGMLRGLHDTRVPMIFAAIGYWGIGIPLSIVLAFPVGLAGSGIWIGLAAGLGSVAVLMTARWVMRERLNLLHIGPAPSSRHVRVAHDPPRRNQTPPAAANSL
jgi:MATE family multidrug resistance protein